MPAGAAAGALGAGVRGPAQRAGALSATEQRDREANERLIGELEATVRYCDKLGKERLRDKCWAEVEWARREAVRWKVKIALKERELAEVVREEAQRGEGKQGDGDSLSSAAAEALGCLFQAQRLSPFLTLFPCRSYCRHR